MTEVIRKFSAALLNILKSLLEIIFGSPYVAILTIVVIATSFFFFDGVAAWSLMVLFGLWIYAFGYRKVFNSRLPLSGWIWVVALSIVIVTLAGIDNREALFERMGKSVKSWRFSLGQNSAKEDYYHIPKGASHYDENGENPVTMDEEGICLLIEESGKIGNGEQLVKVMLPNEQGDFIGGKEAFFPISKLKRIEKAEALELAKQKTTKLEDNVTDLKSKLAALQEKLEKVNEEKARAIKTVKAQKAAAEARAKDLASSLATVNAKIQDLQLGIKSAKQAAQSATSKKKALESELKRVKDDFWVCEHKMQKAAQRAARRKGG